MGAVGARLTAVALKANAALSSLDISSESVI